MRYVYLILAFICLFILLPGWLAFLRIDDKPNDVIHIYIEAWMLITGWLGGMGFSIMTIVSWIEHQKKIQDDTRANKYRNESIPSHQGKSL